MITRSKVQQIFILTGYMLLTACGESSDDQANGNNDPADTLDITDLNLSERSTDCTDYVKHYTSSVLDIQRAVNFDGSLVITVEDDECLFESNAIPNHDFNDASAHFATQVSEQQTRYRISNQPQFASSSTALSLDRDNGLFLNGVKLDLLAAACYGVADEKIGCNDIGTPWRFDPMSPLNEFGTDTHNAHTQPDGTYHYHGNPNALFASSAVEASPVIGFAADGFPIFGAYFSDNGVIRKATSSYQLKSGNRVTASDGSNPGGSYDGRFVDDYEYIEGSGDLDECNGMTQDGHYAYYVTDAYPWVLGCFKGTPHSSFSK